MGAQSKGKPASAAAVQLKIAETPKLPKTLYTTPGEGASLYMCQNPHWQTYRAMLSLGKKKEDFTAFKLLLFHSLVTL
jgi:hypothetical protein